MLDAEQVAMMPNDGGRISSDLIVSHVTLGMLLFKSIKNGFYDRFQAGQNPPAISQDHVAKVMWYLQALASVKASSSAGLALGTFMEFKEGAMLIEDSDGRLQHFFDLANSYHRSSVHFPSYQNQDGCFPKGVDLLESNLPNSRRSILFQKLPEGLPKEGAKFLYVKMEPHSCRNLIVNPTQNDPTGQRYPSGFFGCLKRFFSNLGQAMARLFRGHNNGAAGPIVEPLGARETVNNLENVPQVVVDNFNVLINILRHNFNGYPVLKPIIDGLQEAKAQLRGEGIHAALGAVKRAQCLAEVSSEGGEVKERFKDVLSDFKLGLLEHVGDYPQLRFGREVILTNKEFGYSFPQLLIPSEQMGRIQSRHELTEEESQYLERKLTSTLALQGEDQAEQLRHSLEDLASGAQVRIYKAFPTNITNRVYETEINYGNLGGIDVSEAAVADRARGVFGTINKALLQLSGSQSFSYAVRTLMNQDTFSDLSILAERQFMTQTGGLLTETGLTMNPEFTLVRVTPPASPEQAQPAIVAYYLKALEQGTTHQEVGTGPLRDEVKAEWNLNLRLFHDPQSQQVTVKVVGGTVNYNIQRILN
jgi:hypothetical protein